MLAKKLTPSKKILLISVLILQIRSLYPLIISCPICYSSVYSSSRIGTIIFFISSSESGNRSCNICHKSFLLHHLRLCCKENVIGTAHNCKSTCWEKPSPLCARALAMAKNMNEDQRWLCLHLHVQEY